MFLISENSNVIYFTWESIHNAANENVFSKENIVIILRELSFTAYRFIYYFISIMNLFFNNFADF